MRSCIPPFRMAIIQKFKNHKCWQEFGERGTLIHRRWECMHFHHGKQYGDCSKNLKIDLTYDPASPLLGPHLKEMKSAYGRDTCLPMFTAAQFLIVRTRNQSGSLSTDDWINCSIYTGWNVTQPKKGVKSWHLQQDGCDRTSECWVKLVRHRKTNSMLSLICKAYIHRHTEYKNVILVGI